MVATSKSRNQASIMDMSPASLPKFQSTGGRRADRRSYDAQIQFRKGVKRATVKLRDISQLGARVAGVFLVHEDDRQTHGRAVGTAPRTGARGARARRS